MRRPPTVLVSKRWWPTATARKSMSGEPGSCFCAPMASARSRSCAVLARAKPACGAVKNGSCRPVSTGCCATRPGHRACRHPSRPITMIVPFPAGGGTDVIARIVKQALRGGPGVNRSVRSRRQFEPQAQHRRQTIRGEPRRHGHAGRNLHAPTGSGSASGQGSGQQLAVCADHIADCEGVLGPRRIDH